jgi:NitT/TauT family transport system substrate-binding protein
VRQKAYVAAALALLLSFAIRAAYAEDLLKLAVGQRGNWETAIAEIGERAGLFKKHGLTLEITYTKGAGETIQAVVAGATDIGIGVGTSGAMAAFAKGAPLRVIGNATVGSNDLFWYVRADNPLKSIKEATESTTIAYSTAGSSTDLLVLGFLKTYNLKAKPTKTGSPPATLTAVMSGQVDVGWAAPPFGLKEIEEGKIRIIARGSEVASTRDQTVRTVIANATRLKANPEQFKRFMMAYAEALDYMYANPDALKIYQDFSEIEPARARVAMTEFYPKEALDPYRISGLDGVMEDAISLKFLHAKLKPDELKELIQVPDKN